MLVRQHYVKPDGRNLWLYSRTPISPFECTAIPVPDPQPVALASHMRWHPLLGEWVVFAAHRQDRTFLPPADGNPFAPTIDPARPTELPAGDYSVAVFDNRFPSFAVDPGPPPDLPGGEARPALGRAEIVVFDQDATTSLGALSVEHIVLILEVWADRTKEMAAAGAHYVLPFENRGVEMGATLHHPHGQIYGYGFLPDLQRRTSERLRRHVEERGHDLVVETATRERELGVRVVAARDSAVAFVPPFARFPYETWITPLRPVPDLARLTTAERNDLASSLAESLRRLDGLWGQPMPYLLTVNQVPTDGVDHLGWTVRIEICPIRRSPGKLKYLAGTEIGAGVFVSDVTPERAAAELRAVEL